LLKARDLIASPAFIVIKAADAFKDKTTPPPTLHRTVTLITTHLAIREA
jgi:hypothetical protein